jgi:hypothetical protein
MSAAVSSDRCTRHQAAQVEFWASDGMAAGRVPETCCPGAYHLS